MFDYFLVIALALSAIVQAAPPKTAGLRPVELYLTNDNPKHTLGVFKDIQPYEEQNKAFLERTSAIIVPEVQLSSGICGAPTKDGTPCQRRVEGGGRCYQHR